jgi:hypothetical protein
VATTAGRSKPSRLIGLGHVRWTRLANLAIVLLVLLGIAVALVPTSSTEPHGGGGGGGGKRPLVSYAAPAESPEMAPFAWVGSATSASATGGSEGLA